MGCMDAESKKRFDEIAAALADVISITGREHVVATKEIELIRARVHELEVAHALNRLNTARAGKGKG